MHSCITKYSNGLIFFLTNVSILLVALIIVSCHICLISGILFSSRKHPKTKDLMVNPCTIIDRLVIWFLFFNTNVNLHWISYLSPPTQFLARRFLDQCTEERDCRFCSTRGAWSSRGSGGFQNLFPWSPRRFLLVCILIPLFHTYLYVLKYLFTISLKMWASVTCEMHSCLEPA